MIAQMSEASIPPYTDILYAVLGISPAVLTETVWALAHENPPLIPHRIFVLTTKPGRQLLEQVLFINEGWGRLKKALRQKGFPVHQRLSFGAASDYVRLLPKPDGDGDLEDIVTPEDSQHAADFIMRCLREFTEDSDTRIIASIAGGRKTMGALLTSCMTLLGRKQDRLCHVLVNSPYDSPYLDPPFLFPDQKLFHRMPNNGRRLLSSQAKIKLTDIPFVRVRAWYEREYGHTPPSYMSMVRMVQGLSPKEHDYPAIEIYMDSGRVFISESQAYLSDVEFALFSVLAGRIVEGKPFGSWMDLEHDIQKLRASTISHSSPPWLQHFIEKRFDLQEDARKIASSIRKKIRPIIKDTAVIDGLIPSLKLKNIVSFPAPKIHFRNK